MTKNYHKQEITPNPWGYVGTAPAPVVGGRKNNEFIEPEPGQKKLAVIQVKILGG